MIVSAVDIRDIAFLSGLGMAGYGAERILPGAGWLLCGVLLVFKVEPLRRFF